MLEDCLSMVLLCNISQAEQTSVGSSDITHPAHLCDLLIFNSIVNQQIRLIINKLKFKKEVISQFILKIIKTTKNVFSKLFDM